MLRAFYMLGSLLALAVMAIFLLPLVLFTASRLWEAAELHTVYKGDVAARDKDRWRSS